MQSALLLPRKENLHADEKEHLDRTAWADRLADTH
jgi:hypothetical protein